MHRKVWSVFTTLDKITFFKCPVSNAQSSDAQMDFIYCSIYGYAMIIIMIEIGSMDLFTKWNRNKKTQWPKELKMTNVRSWIIKFPCHSVFRSRPHQRNHIFCLVVHENRIHFFFLWCCWLAKSFSWVLHNQQCTVFRNPMVISSGEKKEQRHKYFRKIHYLQKSETHFPHQNQMECRKSFFTLVVYWCHLFGSPATKPN